MLGLTFNTYRTVLTVSSIILIIGTLATLGGCPPAFLLAAFVLTYVAAEWFQVVFPSGAALSFGSTVTLAAIAWLGPQAGVLLQSAGALASGVITRTPAVRLAENFSNYVLSAAGAALVYRALGGAPGQAPGSGMPALALSIVTLCAAQALFTALALSLYKVRPLWACLRDLGGLSLLLSLGAASLSIPFLWGLEVFGPSTALVATVVVIVLASSVSRVAALRSQRRALTRLLPLAPAPQTGVSDRAEALFSLVSALASAAGLPVEEAEALQNAALLHDAGFTETDAQAAASQDPLTPEQLRKIREHPRRAAMRVGEVGNLLWVARILETHHEHYNGWGYPFGLKGDEIPLPAALLGLAEAYLALTTPRPYRTGTRSPQQTVEYLRAHSGEQFHPAAVAAIEKLLESGALERLDTPGASRLVEEAVSRLRRAKELPGLPGRPFPEATPRGFWLAPVWRTRWLLARLFSPWTAVQVLHRTSDWYRSLYELGQVFSSSLDLGDIARHLSQAVHNLTTLPCEVCLVQEDGETLSPVASLGLPPGATAGLTRKVNRGLTGVAFAESRPVVSLDMSNDPRALQPDKVRELGLKSYMVVPLAVAGTPLGTISVYSPAVERFSPAESEILTAVANLAALTLQNAVLYAKASDRLVELIETQSFLRTVLNTAPIGILTLDARGRLSLANRVAYHYLETLGLEAGSGGVGKGGGARDGNGAGGAGQGDLAEGLRARLGFELRGASSAGGEVAGPETVRVAGTGGDRFFQVWVAPLGDTRRERAGGLLVILNDVSAAKKLEAEASRNERLAAAGEMAARAAHEIRNPLTSLQGFAQLLRLYCPVRDQWGECSTFIDRIREEVERLDEIVESMLVLARPACPDITRGDLSLPVLEVVSGYAGRAAELATVLEGPVEPGGVTAYFDSRQIRQVLMNLIQNALDAVSGPGGPPPGQRRVVVSVGFRRRSGRRLACVRVRDNGPGLPPGDEAQIFTPFFTTKDGGTGLGLAVSKGIVEAHGGAIEVRPTRGPGTVFEVLLPTSSTRAPGSWRRPSPREG
ncbi:MAG: HD domain-containing phosphohydrolase [Bacillota bacterium]